MTLSSRPRGHAVKKRKFSEEQIAYALQQAEPVAPVSCPPCGHVRDSPYIFPAR
ncbi:hypothetical protein BDI4_20092 [Burkholderia diffusa]|nr:hypothetical protein BDI4_20092 [Burkholderia diffusa]